MTVVLQRKVRLILGPGPHDAAIPIVEQALGRKETIIDPTHLLVMRGIKLFIAPLAEVIAGTQLVTDAEQNVLAI